MTGDVRQRGDTTLLTHFLRNPQEPGDFIVAAFSRQVPRRLVRGVLWMPKARDRRPQSSHRGRAASERSAETRLVLLPISDTVGLLDVLPLGAA